MGAPVRAAKPSAWCRACDRAIQLADVQRAVADVPPPHISPQRGAILYDHIRRTRPAQALELGTARGVSAAYIAAAIEENGEGRLVSVDSSVSLRSDPSRREVLDRAGPSQRVSFTDLRIQDEWWAWAHKAPGEPRDLRIETSRSGPAARARAFRRGRRHLRTTVADFRRRSR